MKISINVQADVPEDKVDALRDALATIVEQAVGLVDTEALVGTTRES